MGSRSSDLYPVQPPHAASITVMPAVARCHGTMPPERFHSWLEAGWRAAAGEGELLVLERRGRRH